MELDRKVGAYAWKRALCRVVEMGAGRGLPARAGRPARASGSAGAPGGAAGSAPRRTVPGSLSPDRSPYPGRMIGVLVRIPAAAAGAGGAAVARELDKPSQDRQWHGEIAGVPYDFRPPTVEKVRRSAWDPDNPKTVVPPAFGVGWSVNFARLAKLVQPPAEPAGGRRRMRRRHCRPPRHRRSRRHRRRPPATKAVRLTRCRHARFLDLRRRSRRPRPDRRLDGPLPDLSRRRGAAAGRPRRHDRQQRHLRRARRLRCATGSSSRPSRAGSAGPGVSSRSGDSPRSPSRRCRGSRPGSGSTATCRRRATWWCGPTGSTRPGSGTRASTGPTCRRRTTPTARPPATRRTRPTARTC